MESYYKNKSNIHNLSLIFFNFEKFHNRKKIEKMYTDSEKTMILFEIKMDTLPDYILENYFCIAKLMFLTSNMNDFFCIAKYSDRMKTLIGNVRAILQPWDLLHASRFGLYNQGHRHSRIHAWNFIAVQRESINKTTST